ncbi:MAG: hypothetical protein QJR00_02210 [Bacillota bacterium]|nr:hypothetical protein [Bacillota bacterium]
MNMKAMWAKPFQYGKHTVRVLGTFVGGTLKALILLFIAGTAVAFIGDGLGLPSFRLVPGGLLLYRFQAGEGGSFFGELGEGAFYLAALLGVLQAAAALGRMMRQPQNP